MTGAGGTSPDFIAHHRGQAPIDAYGNGGFRFAGMSHKGSLLIVPSGIYAWDVETVAGLTADSFKLVFLEAARVDVVLVGTGSSQVFLDQCVVAVFQGKGLVVEGMATGAAARTYNVLLGEKRAVAVALIAVD